MNPTLLIWLQFTLCTALIADLARWLRCHPGRRPGIHEPGAMDCGCWNPGLDPGTQWHPSFMLAGGVAAM